MWCKTCGYALDGLGEGRCPECGTPIDLDKSIAARRWPAKRTVTYQLILIGISLIFCILSTTFYSCYRDQIPAQNRGWVRWPPVPYYDLAQYSAALIWIAAVVSLSLLRRSFKAVSVIMVLVSGLLGCWTCVEVGRYYN